MLNIRLLKTLLIILIFLFSVNIVFGVEPAPCDPNKDGVKVGDWCYNCGDSDGVCPNDFVADTCTPQTTIDPDCVSGICSQRIQSECTLVKDTQGNNCEWIPDCGGVLDRFCSYDTQTQSCPETARNPKQTDQSGNIIPSYRCVVQGSTTYQAVPGFCNTNCLLPSSQYCQQKTCGPNMVGGCQNQCVSYQCQECDLSCSCVQGWANANGDPVDGCEKKICDNSETSCIDGKDNDCDNKIDCADTECAGIQGPNNKVCCQSKNNCPADGSVSYSSCSNDNTLQGTQQTYSCTSNECIASNQNIQGSCNTGCCLPGQGGSVCKNPDKSSMMDIDTDAKNEICSGVSGSGNWIGANCQGQSCVTDPAQTESYNCVADNDCAGLNPGQCGEVKCINNQCITQAKADAQSVCQGIAAANGYQCGVYTGCTQTQGTQWQCGFYGESTLCGNPNNPNSYDLGCDGNFKCTINLCNQGQNPCGLCYSQCLIAANDPNRAPYSAQECVKNGLWAQCGGF